MASTIDTIAWNRDRQLLAVLFMSCKLLSCIRMRIEKHRVSVSVITKTTSGSMVAIGLNLVEVSAFLGRYKFAHTFCHDGSAAMHTRACHVVFNWI
jgi:hypothetical protein